MIYHYKCKSCYTLSEVDISLSDKDSNWRPPFNIQCPSCNQKSIRVWGCNIGVQNNSDEVKNVGQSKSSANNIEFVGKGFPDSDRKIQEEIDEIESLMDEPPTQYDIAAANQQMEELEREKGKPKGFYSGEREREDVEFQKMSDQEMHQEAARLSSSLQKQVGFQEIEEEGKKIVKVSPDNLKEVASEYGNSVYNLSNSDKVKVRRVKRRGKDQLSEEAKQTKMNRS